jgi:hypothetical protein
LVAMSSSSSPSCIWVVLDSSSSSTRKYGFKSAMLNVGLTPKSTGRSSLYALSLIHSSTLNGPSARGINLDFLKAGNLSFLKCKQTKSPGSKINCFLEINGTR